MTKRRRRHSASFKFKVALEACKGEQTASQLAQRYGVHPSQISSWKRKLIQEGPELFQRGGKERPGENEKREAELYEQIGRLQMELEWVKKKAALFE